MRNKLLEMQLGKAKVQAQPQTLIVMSVAGSGKSGVGKLLAAKLD
jgi:adenylylsulfate kinase-like enzyme